MRQFLLAAVALALAGLGGWYWYTNRNTVPSFRTAAVQRGDMVITISATGTVEPEEVVDVGAQVAGMIKALGTDPHDPKKTVYYGTVVEQGTILARIDDALYATDVEQARAAVDAAKASAEKSRADVLQYKAKLTQSERDFRRVQDLRRTPGA